VSGSTVYAGGGFTTIGGQPRNRIAALDTSTGLATTWNPSTGGAVYTLAVGGSTVYAGGTFGEIGGQTRSFIAALDASTGLATAWNPNANTTVLTLAVSGDRVYAGGNFTTIGGLAQSYVVALRGSGSNLSCLSAASGRWNASANWDACGETTPMDGDNVTVGAGHTIVQYQSTALDNLTNNGSLYLPPLVTLSAEGTVTNNGTLTHLLSAPNGATTRFGTLRNAAGSAVKYYGVDLTPAGAMGYTTVAIQGNQAQCHGSDTLIKRCFDIAPTTAQNATVRFWYLNAEKGVNDPATLQAYHFNGSDWDLLALAATPRGTVNDYEWVEAIDVSAYSPFGLTDSHPTAVSLASFEALWQGEDVRIAWETAEELDNLGFKLYRGSAPQGPWTQLNPALIPAQNPGGTSGAVYEWVDMDAVPGSAVYYRLEDLDIHGASTFHGPVRPAETGPSTVRVRALDAATAPGALCILALALTGVGALAFSSWRRRAKSE